MAYMDQGDSFCPVCYGPVCLVTTAHQEFIHYVVNGGSNREVMRLMLINTKLEVERHLKILNNRALKDGVITPEIHTWKADGTKQVVDPSNQGDSNG